MEPDTNKTQSQPSHPPYTDLPPGPPPEDRVMTLVSRNLTPTPVVYEKQLLIWQPENPGDSVTVNIPPGLCVGLSGNVTATYDQPALCTIAEQDGMLDNESRKYTYSLSSATVAADPDVFVKRCIGCP
jgi:hypothetical protein